MLDENDNDGKHTTFTCLIKCHLGVCVCVSLDCESGDDEKSCKIDEKPVKRACADDEYQCKDGRCILVS